jgi:hypothetical protein
MSSGLLDEHAPRGPREEGAKSVYEPSDEERKAIHMVKRLFERAKRHRAKYDTNWLHYYQMFRGRQWTDQRPSYRHSEVINMIFKSIQNQVPLQTDSRPRIGFVAKEPEDLEFAQILSELCESDWENNNWLMRLTEVLYDSSLYGIGYSTESYNQDLNLGQGSATYQSVDPLECYPDPDAYEINDRENPHRSEFFIRAEPIDVDKLKAEYPNKADYIKPDLATLLSDDRSDSHQIKVRSALDARVVTDHMGATSQSMAENKALKITCWVRDNTVVEEMVKCTDLDGNEYPEYEQRLKFPNGRKICIASDVLLDDGDNPFDDGEFPYSKHVNYMLPREFYGISEVENLEGPQKTFNKLVSFALDVLTLMGNPVWINPSSSGVDSETLTNRPGLVVEPNDPGHGMQRLEGVQLQPYVMQLIQSFQQWFDDEAGTNDITRGIQPTGVSAASAISQLQDAAQTRIRQKSRFIDAYLGSVARHWLARVLQFYTVPRVHRVTSREGAAKYFRFSVAKTSEGETVMRYTPYKSVGGSLEEQQTRERIIQGQFDVQITTGSSLPFAKADKEQRLFSLFDRGIIDAQEVLNGLDYPNAKELIQRMQQKAEAQAAAQQQPGAPSQ